MVKILFIIFIQQYVCVLFVIFTIPQKVNKQNVCQLTYSFLALHVILFNNTKYYYLYMIQKYVIFTIISFKEHSYLVSRKKMYI